MIGQAIIAGEYDGSRMLPVELEISRRFNVGRNVVREAVKTLAGKGLLRTVRRAGTHVLPRHSWNLIDPDVLEWTMTVVPLRNDLLQELTQLRMMIEPEVSALAALNASITETLRIQEAYDAMERHARDPALAIEADILFHTRLFEAAGNSLVSSLLQGFALLLRANFELTIHTKGGFIRNLEEHRLVADAVRLRDPESARRAMRKLLENNQSDVDTMLHQREAEQIPGIQ